MIYNCILIILNKYICIYRCPETTKKKREREYSDENVEAAITDVRSGKVSQYLASKKYHIPRSTLNDHLQNKHSTSVGRPCRLSVEEEKQIVETCIIFSEWGYGLGKKEIISVVADLFKDGVPGDDWWYAFLSRHPNLSVRKPQALQISRAKASNNETIDYWFYNILQPMLDKTGLKAHPNRIFNVDETSFSLCGRPQKVVTQRGAKSPQFIVGGTGKENITVHACVSASGTLLPPYILYTGQRLMMNYTQSGPVGSRYGVSNKGWMNEVNFLDWFQNLFLPSLPEERPVLLILDGHESHVKYQFRELAVQHGVEVLKLHPTQHTYYSR